MKYSIDIFSCQEQILNFLIEKIFVLVYTCHIIEKVRYGMFTKIIKHQLVEKDLKVSDLARMLQTSYQNLDQKMKRDNFSEKEMRQIADVLQLELKITME